jgi:hypothetical protein
MVRQLAGTPGKLRQTVDEASEMIIWAFWVVLRGDHQKFTDDHLWCALGRTLALKEGSGFRSGAIRR